LQIFSSGTVRPMREQDQRLLFATALAKFSIKQEQI
jgi:hypothetical protein